MKPILLAIVTLVLLVAVASAQTMQTYDDCLLRHLKDAGSIRAAELIEQACRGKFPAFSAEEQRYFEQLDFRISRELCEQHGPTSGHCHYFNSIAQHYRSPSPRNDVTGLSPSLSRREGSPELRQQRR